MRRHRGLDRLEINPQNLGLRPTSLGQNLQPRARSAPKIKNLLRLAQQFKLVINLDELVRRTRDITLTLGLPKEPIVKLPLLRHRSTVGARVQTVDQPDSGQSDAVHVARAQAAAARKRSHALDPTSIGPWNVAARIGSGGMGIVYLVEHRDTNQVAALKVLRPGLESVSAGRRFVQEIEILQRLEHPAIARIYDAGVATLGIAPCHYYAMEYVPGYHLVRHAEINDLSVKLKLELFARVCDGMAYAHGQGVLHRDLKPQNIVIEMGGGPKILDFGVARLTADGTSTMHTQDGQMLGTVQYMPPEQILGLHGQLDASADVYALGVVLYQLIFGQLPYDGSKKAAADLLQQIRQGEPNFPSLDPDLAEDHRRVMLVAMSPNRVHRYKNAAELADEVRRLIASQPIRGTVVRLSTDEPPRPGLGARLRNLIRRSDTSTDAARE